MADDLVLHYSVFSRSFTAIWMLEELGAPYRLVERDIRTKQNRTPEYLAINPSGRVPTLQVGSMIVTELPAICLWLADRYGAGTLAPLADDPDRGPFLKWLFWTTAILEPATALRGAAISWAGERPNWGPSWGDQDEAVAELREALRDREYVVGDHLTAADVVLGGALSVRLFARMLPEDPVIVDYTERLKARPACLKAQVITWPPHLFAVASG